MLMSDDSFVLEDEGGAFILDSLLLTKAFNPSLHLSTQASQVLQGGL